jgi:hypothetical protein
MSMAIVLDSQGEESRNNMSMESISEEIFLRA